MGRIQGRLPAFGKTLLKRDEEFIYLFVVISPVRGGTTRAVIAILLPPVFQRGRPPQVGLLTSIFDIHNRLKGW